MAAYRNFLPPQATFAQLMATQTQFASMVSEAQMVIALRVLGMLGAWNVAPSENDRMVREKQAAFAKSGSAAFAAAMAGKRPDQIMASAVRPLRSRTRANARRLSKRGPRAGLT